MKDITHFEDLIDSRDIIDRIEYLRDWADFPAAKKELAVLESVQEDAEQYASEWRYGEALIRDSYFKEYAQELAEDCGMVEDSNQWPNRCLDWDQAAEELKYDYTTVDFDGVDYWVRAY